MLEIWKVVIVAFISFVLGAAAGIAAARWWFIKQFKKIEKKYQQSVRQTYQDMGNFFGRKMSEEALNKITTQIEGETEKKKTSPKKPKPKKKK